MGKPIENDDNAKKLWENLSDATALSGATKTALRGVIGAEAAGAVAALGFPPYADLATANAAMGEIGQPFFNIALGKVRNTTSAV